MAQIGVLLVGFEPLPAVGTRRILEAEGDFVVVGTAADGEAGLALARRERPDLALLDLRPARSSCLGWVRAFRRSVPEMLLTVLDGKLDGTATLILQRQGVRGCFLTGMTATDFVDGLREVQRGQGRVFFAAAEVAAAAIRAGTPPTPRQLEVLSLLAQGLSNDDMARRLGCTPRTVEYHLSQMRRQLAVHSRGQLAYEARERGWLR